MKISRRSFTAGLLTTSALGGIPESRAWFPRGLSQDSFNGGKSQLNLGTLGNDFEYSFANMVLTGSDWSISGGPQGNGIVNASVRDANGYPTSLPGGHAAAAKANFPASVARPGNYVIRCTGSGTVGANNTSSPLTTASLTGVLASGVLTASAVTGTINVGQALLGTGVTAGSCIGTQLTGTTGGAGTYLVNNYLTGMASTQSLASVAMTTSNGSATMVNGANQRYVWYPGNSGAPNQMTYDILTQGSPYISQFAIMHVNDEMAWVNDPYAFHPQFLSVLKTGGWGVLRDLDWVNGIDSCVSTWNYRKPTSYFSFVAGEISPRLFATGGAVNTGTVLAISGITFAPTTQNASFTGSTSGATLTVSGVTGTINIGDFVYAQGLNANTTITAGSGTTWTISSTPPSAVSGAAMTSGSQAGTATVTTSTAHGQTGTFLVAIDGNLTINQGSPTLNGTFTGTVTSTTQFTYPLTYTPCGPTTLGTVNIGLYGYALSFTDPVYGSGGPTDKQTVQFYFDHLACANSNTGATFSGTNTVLWSGHTFSGGELIGFHKGAGNANLPVNIGEGATYYVLAAGLVAGTSFEFSTSPAGSPVSFSGATGTASCARLYTLNLNSGGAAPMFLGQGGTLILPPSNYGASGTQGAVPSPLTVFQQPSLCTAVYDAALGAWQITGGSLSGGSGLQNYCPPEMFIKLCKAIGAHPHLCVPMYTLDPMSDYLPQLYNLVKSQAPWMIPRFEPSDEIWNTAQPNTTFAGVKAFNNWNAQFTNGSFDYANWVGKVVSNMGQVLAQMAGTVGNGYRILIGSQTVTWTTTGSNGNSARFLSPNYVSQSQSGQTLSVPALGLNITFSKAAAYLYATHAIGANYLNPANWNTFNPATFIANYAIFTGSITAGVLTVTSMNPNQGGVGALVVGQTIADYYGQIPAGVTIASFGSGGGGTGTYNLSNSSFNAISTTMVAQNATAIAQVFSFVDALNGAASNYNNAQVLAYFTNIFNYAQTLTNNAANKLGCTCYEGGYGPDYVSGGSLNTLFEAAKYNSDMGIALTTGGTLNNSTTINGNYADLIALGVDFPSAFNLGGLNNPWTVCDPDIYVMPSLPSFTAIAAYNV